MVASFKSIIVFVSRVSVQSVSNDRLFYFVWIQTYIDPNILKFLIGVFYFFFLLIDNLYIVSIILLN